MKTISYIIYTALALFAFACFSLLPAAKAVIPPPDGGYPGFNTAEGTNALKNLSTGVGNAAVGWNSLFSNTDGSFNTALGAGTLLFNVGDQGNGDGTQNTAIGTLALFLNTTGYSNTANGAFALFSNTEGSGNTANGDHALYSNDISFNNAAFGASALFSHTAGDYNNAVGALALFSDIGGAQNNAFGGEALFSNTIGAADTAVGDTALHENTTGSLNTAIGALALYFNVGGNFNTALGAGAGASVTGSSNICIGANVSGVAAESNRIRIGDNLPTGSGQSACYIGGIAGQAIDPGTAVTVGIDANGKLGTVASSRRFKRDIKPMDKASEAIHSLKPATFHYRSDAKNTPCFGLIAEEVAAINPDLVVHDKNGDVHTVRYDAINAMLLNEFLKEHRKVQELGASIAQMKSEMNSLVAHIKEQDSKIQQVGDQLEISKAAQQVATTK